MRRRFGPSLLALLAAVGVALPALPALPAAAPVGGSVLDAAGRPVAGVRVELREPVAPWRQMAAELAGETLPPLDAARTGSDGRFELAAPAGLWVLQVTAPGFDLLRRAVSLDGEPYELGEIALEEGHGIELTVTGAGGRPVAGARVSAAGDAAGGLLAGQPAHPRRAVTGAAGRASLQRPPGAVTDLAAVAPGMAPARHVLAAGDAAAILRLHPGVPWVIEVRDGQRRPVAGAVIATEGTALPLAVTGEDGRAEVRLPEDEEVPLAAAAAAGTGRFVALPRPPASDETAETPRAAVVVLEPPGSLPGRVLAGAGRRPLAGARVWHWLRPDLQATSGDDGRFALPLEPGAVASGKWLVAAAAAGHDQRWQSLSPQTGEAVFVLAPLAAISGRVVDETGEPVAGASLVAASRGRWQAGRRPGGERTTSGDDGRFRLVRLDPEEVHLLVVEHPGFATTETEVTAPVAGAARPGVEIVLVRGNRAHGLVFAADGLPLAAAVVRLSPARPQAGGTTPRRVRPGDEPGPPRATTDAEGRFVLEHLLPGRYDLHVAAAGHAPLRAPGVEVPEAPADGDLGSVYLEPGADIAGRVVDGDGEPVAGVEVHLYARDLSTGMGSGSAEERATTAADGRFVLPDLTPASVVDLMFQAAGFAQETVMGVTAPPERPLLVELVRSAVVAGRVVDGFGAGIAGASVHARTDEAGSPGRRRYDSRPAFALSEEDGSFVLEGVPPGAVRLAATAAGFRPGESAALEVSPGERREGERIELERGGRLVGQVTGPDGQPLPEALVRVSPNLVQGGLESRTDGDGGYRIEGLPEGVLQVRAEHADYVETVREVTAGAGELRLDLRLTAGHRVSGRVVDDGGAPLEGVRISLGGVRGMARPVTSRADGTFAAEGVAPGAWRIWAGKDGYVTTGEPSVEVAGPVDGIEVRMMPAAAIVGRVRGVDAAEIARLHVAATPDGGRGATRSGAVDYEGGFRIDGLTPGRWRVMALLGEGEGMASGEVELAPGDRQARIDLDLSGNLELSGRVTLGGEPLAGSEVSLTGRETVSFGRVRTGADGRFRIGRLERGRYELTVHDFVEGVSHRRDLDLDGDREVSIDLEVGEVAGRVVDGETGAPLAAAEVRLGPDDLGHPPIGLRTRSGEPDGAFRLRRVPAGAHRLHASREGYGTADIDVVVRPGGAIEGLELALHPAGAAVLQVGVSAGPPPGQVMVAALAPGAPPPPADRLWSPAAAGGHYAPGEAGRVHLASLAAGRWRIHVAAPGLAATAVDLTAPGPPVPVVLAPEALVDVRVPGLAQSPTGGRVRLLAPSGEPLVVAGYGATVHAAWPLRLGRARLANVPAGPWTVEVAAGDGRVWSRQLTALAGAAVEVVVE